MILVLLKFLGDAEPTTTDRENLVSLLEDTNSQRCGNGESIVRQPTAVGVEVHLVDIPRVVCRFTCDICTRTYTIVTAAKVNEQDSAVEATNEEFVKRRPRGRGRRGPVRLRIRHSVPLPRSGEYRDERELA